MLVDDLRNDFVLYLVAIKQAFEGGKYSDADGVVLRALFLQGLLYRSILENKLLCDDAVLKGIEEFCGLIERDLPPPVLGGAESLNLILVGSGAGAAVSDSLVFLHEQTNLAFKEIVVGLLSIFQLSILDLSVVLKSEGQLSAKDVENTNYVIGMAEITSINLGKIIERPSGFGDVGFGKAQKFFSDVVRFAGSLRASGLGALS